jgi:transposase
VAHRHELTDAQWIAIAESLPKRRGPDSIRGDRAFVNAILYRAKTGCPWRDLPERYGPWKTIYNRFNEWSHRGTWAKLLKALQLEADEDGCIIDASVVRAHQDASGGKGGSKSMRWGTLEVASPRSSMHSLTPKVARFTSNSRRGSSTSPR